LAVRLFIGNLPYGASEADLRAHLSAVAEPSHVAMPVDRETGRPRGFAFVEFAERAVAEEVIKKFDAQPFQGRPLAVSEARAREDRGPGAPRPGGYSSGPRPAGGGFAPRPTGGFGAPRPFDSGTSAPGGAAGRSRNFGPDAKPQRGGSAKGKKKGEDKPRGPIPLKNTGHSFNLDDVDTPDEKMPEIDDVATSKPSDELDKDDDG